MTHRARLRAAHGFVLVPVMAFLTVSLGLAFAMLLLVERQIHAAGEQRDLDATQVLAEGVKAATANVLALPDADAWWTGTGCHVVTGDLATAPAAGTTDDTRLRAAIAREVQRSFQDAEASTTYARAGRTVAWSATVCPTTDTGAGTDGPYTDAVLSRTGATGTINGRRSLWVRAQARVRDAQGRSVRVRAVAEKVRQGATPFVPPTTFAVGTGTFASDLGTQAAQLFRDLSRSSIVLDGAIGKVLGVSNRQLIEDDAARIGVRCGLLNGLEDTTNLQIDPASLNLGLCLGGMFSGLDDIAQRTGLDALLGPTGLNLGLNRFTALDTFAMAPSIVQDAYRSTALLPLSATDARTTAYLSPVAGSSDPATAPECAVDWSTVTTSRVLYIAQVGDGEQYCQIPAGRTVQAKAVVVARGRIVVRGRIESLLYLLNRNECDAAPRPSSCTVAIRRASRPSGKPREVARIEQQGSVLGAVWADGAYSQVGLYPATAANEVTVGNEITRVLGNLVQRADAIVDSQVCNISNAGVPIVTPLLNAVTGLLNGVLQLVGSLVAGTVSTQILPAGVTPQSNSAAPTTYDQACRLFNTALITQQAAVKLLDVSKLGGTVPITNAKVWVRKTAGLLSPAYDWRLATAQEIASSGATVPTSFQIPAVSSVLSSLGTLIGNEPTVVDLLNMVTNVFSNRTMVERDASVITRSQIDVPNGLVRVPGTFRSARASG
jgi:hypothetical protein